MNTYLTLLLFFGTMVAGIGYCIASMWAIGPTLKGLPGPPERYMPSLVRKIYNFCFWTLMSGFALLFVRAFAMRLLGIG